MAFLNRNPAKAIEAEVASLTTRRDGFLARLADATARAEAAVAEQQRVMLATDGGDPAALRKAGDAARRAADDRAVLEDHARTLTGMVENAQARLAAIRDRAERDRTAGEIEARARRIEEAAAVLSAAAAAFDLARERVVQACREGAPRDVLGGGPEYGIVSAAARQAGITSRENLQPWTTMHLDAVPAAAETVQAMRSKARAIREGAAPNVPPPKPERIPTTVAWPEIPVVLARPARYRRANGHQVGVLAGGATLPEPIAARAIELGVGFPPGSVQGRQIIGILAVNPNAGIRPDGIGGFRGDNATAIVGAKMTKAEAIPQADLGELPRIDADGVFARAAE